LLHGVGNILAKIRTEGVAELAFWRFKGGFGCNGLVVRI